MRVTLFSPIVRSIVSVSAVCLIVRHYRVHHAAAALRRRRRRPRRCRRRRRRPCRWLGSSVQVPEKSGFCANATVATARTAAAMIPTLARFMRLLLMMMQRVS